MVQGRLKLAGLPAHGVKKGGKSSTMVDRLRAVPTTRSHEAPLHVHVPPGRSADAAPSHAARVAYSDAHTEAKYARGSLETAKVPSPVSARAINERPTGSASTPLWGDARRGPDTEAAAAAANSDDDAAAAKPSEISAGDRDAYGCTAAMRARTSRVNTTRTPDSTSVTPWAVDSEKPAAFHSDASVAGAAAYVTGAAASFTYSCPPTSAGAAATGGESTTAPTCVRPSASTPRGVSRCSGLWLPGGYTRARAATVLANTPPGRGENMLANVCREKEGGCGGRA